MTLVTAVRNAAGGGRSSQQIAAELAVPRPVVDAVVEQLVRIGALAPRPTGCDAATACPPVGCGGCPIALRSPR